MDYTFSDIGFMLLIGQRARCFAYSMKIIGSVVAVMDSFFYIVEMAFFIILKHFEQKHFIAEVIEDNQIFI